MNKATSLGSVIVSKPAFARAPFAGASVLRSAAPQRYPGRVLGADEMPPVTLVSFIARQLGVNPAAFTKYSQRDQTRREQLAELMERLGYRSFDRASFRHYMAWLTPIAQNIRRPDLLEELRRDRILIPGL